MNSHKVKVEKDSPNQESRRGLEIIIKALKGSGVDADNAQLIAVQKKLKELSAGE